MIFIRIVKNMAKFWHNAKSSIIEDSAISVNHFIRKK
jgi:hypothetical protein